MISAAAAATVTATATAAVTAAASATVTATATVTTSAAATVTQPTAVAAADHGIDHAIARMSARDQQGDEDQPHAARHSAAMYPRAMKTLLALVWLSTPAFAGDVFDVCKGESKTVVAGTGQLSIAVVYPNDFPVTTTPVMRNAVGAALATAEKAKIVPAKDVEAAKKLVGEKKWSDKTDACGYAPSLVAVLGLVHPNLSTAHTQVQCADTKCELIVDLERHGRPTKERFVRYVAPLAGPKDKVDTITAAAKHLTAKGEPPDVPKAGLAVSELPSGTVTTRSDADGALELDRSMEANAAFAACGPKKRKGPHDTRGYWAEWKLSARGTAMEVFVKPFGGADPQDEDAAKCLAKALRQMQMACPRDGKVIPVKTAICL